MSQSVMLFQRSSFFRQKTYCPAATGGCQLMPRHAAAAAVTFSARRHAHDATLEPGLSPADSATSDTARRQLAATDARFGFTADNIARHLSIFTPPDFHHNRQMPTPPTEVALRHATHERPPAYLPHAATPHGIQVQLYSHAMPQKILPRRSHFSARRFRRR